MMRKAKRLYKAKSNFEVIMEAIKFLKYILSRIGIMIVLTLFSAFAGIVLIPALVTVFPSSSSAFKSFMTNSNIDSFIGFAVMLIFFLRKLELGQYYNSVSSYASSVFYSCNIQGFIQSGGQGRYLL